MRKFKKILLVFIITIISIIVITIIFISPITKYLIEKYDEKYTGRQITLDWAYVNPFTGYIHFNDLKIYEFKSDSIFFSANGISASFAITKMLSKTYEINEFSIDNPKCTIIQNKKVFNFNDLIDKFSSKEKPDTTKAPVHFSILSIKIIDGEFLYREQITPINYFIKKLNLESSGTRWDADTIAGKFSFIQGIGSGDVKGDFNINSKTKDYRSAIIVHKLDLNIIEQYLKNLSNYGTFSANLDADIKAKGNFNNEEDITIKGMLAINEFHFGKSSKEDFVSFDKLILAIEELSPKNHQYLLDSISLNHPYFKYEKYDYLDNLQTMFGAKGSNIKAAKADPAQFNLIIEIGDYIKVLSKNFFKSNYKINRLAVYHGDVKFNDYSINEKFSISLNPLSFISDSIDKNHKRVEAAFKSAIKPYGDVSITLSINPKDSSDFDLHYHLKKLSAAMFNPYIISYTSFPLDRGTIELNGNWHVKNGNIKSKNHLLIIDPRATKRIKNKGTKWIPLWLVMAFVRERGNVIDYEVPITGNLKNPKFHLHDIVVDVLTNIFIKPVTTPYIVQVKTIEAEIEKSLTLKWSLANYSLKDNQKKFIEKMADFLVENPQATISIYPKLYTIKEKEYILFFEAKKKYFLLINHKKEASFNEDDSEKVEKMSVKDSLFVEYLNKHIKGTLLFTLQDKCTEFIGPALISTKFKELNEQRVNSFMLYFKDKGVENRVKINLNENTIPYNGFSFYKIEYKGEFPKSLIKAYQKMNELNDKEPREKFEKQREKNKNTFQ